MNLIITKNCNRSCPYCFAKNHLNKNSQDNSENYISTENYNRILDFLKKNNRNKLKLLGGEPTIHPDFTQLLDIALEQNFNITIFTNGLWADELYHYFESEKTKDIKFLFNINEARFDKQSNIDTIRRSLRTAGNRGQCGYNIFREEFDITFLKEYIDSYSMKREIRLGLTAPIVGTSNSFISEDSLKIIGDRLSDQLEELEKHNILGHLDCGFTLCMFPEKKFGSLYKSVKNFSLSCSPVFDVGTDLKIWPCFPLEQMKSKYLTSFNTIDEIENYFNKQLSALRQFGSTEDCFDCKHIKRNQCSGGCIARNIKKIYDNTDSDIIAKLNNI